jgi:DNA/RNA endonuclease YhcR with UshA esterase domain
VVGIFGSDRSKFANPESTFAGETVLATGEVGKFAGVPQIKANDPSDITIC